MNSFTCPDCGAVSYHPSDIEHGYCGRCHAFTRNPLSVEQMQAIVEETRRAENLDFDEETS